MAGEWRGAVALESRLFLRDPLHPEQQHQNLSLVFRPEYHHDWAEGRQRLVFSPFFRIDQHDDERTHFDIRELYWEKSVPKYDLRLGIRKVFWGVTESQHLVDIINQTDLVENIDTEDKLGQPMINLALIRDWGVLDLFVLPGFRERTFPGPKGRFRGPIPVEVEEPEYESSAEEWRVDWAARWTKVVGGWDIGLSYFYGTSREPRLIPRLEGLRVELVPYYDVIHQTGLDVQYTRKSWLWKLEAIHRGGQGRTFTAVTAGFEYTFFGAFGTDADIGLLAEYLWDSRGDDAPTPFQNDVFFGTRIGFNDVQNTQLLAGFIIDPGSGAVTFNLEASRRIRDSWVLSLEARAFTGVPRDDPLRPIRKDDYIQLELAYHF